MAQHLPSGAVATHLSTRVAAARRGCRRHSGRLRDSRVARVCHAGRAAAPPWHLLLPPGRRALRPVRHVAPAGRWSDVSDLAAGWNQHRGHGRWQRCALCGARRADRARVLRHQPCRLGVTPQLAGCIHQRDEPAWLQGGRSHHDRHDPAAEAVRCSGRR